MSRKNPKAGEGPCPHCSRPVFFRSSASGKLSYACDGCDSSGYADPGGQAHREWTASITKPAEQPPAPAPAATPAAPPPAASKKPPPQSSAFRLGGL